MLRQNLLVKSTLYKHIEKIWLKLVAGKELIHRPLKVTHCCLLTSLTTLLRCCASSSIECDAKTN